MLKGFCFSLLGQIIIAVILALIVVYITPDSVLHINNPFIAFVGLLKTIYIDLLKMIVGLVVLFALLDGITSLGKVVKLKEIGIKTLAVYSLTSVIAICLGLAGAFLGPEWAQLKSAPEVDNVQLIYSDDASFIVVIGNLLEKMLANPFAALASNNLLAIVFFSMLMGIALIIALPEKHEIFKVIKGANLAINKLIGWIIKLAPLAIFSIVIEFSISSDFALFSELIRFALLVFSLTMLHGFIVLPLLAKLFAKRPFFATLKKMAPPMAMALATSSSSATLPLTIQTARESLNISKSTSSTVLPLGAIINMDGTALFEGVAAIFLAQLYGIELSTLGIVIVFIMSMLSSIGAPGMPSGSMSGMQLVLISVGIPLEAIAILLLIERPLDTFRTAVNVEGDMVAAMIVDKWRA